MGYSTFVFIESKTFEFVVEEGGTFYLLRIYERGRNALCSVCMGKESAMRILILVEELISKQSPGQFASTVREGDKVFIMQLGSNAHDSFLILSELFRGKHKGFIVIPEGRLGSGWRGFGKTVVPIQQGILGNQKRVSKAVTVVVEKPWKKGGGVGNKGKEKISEIQISNDTISGDHVPLEGNSEKVKAQFVRLLRLRGWKCSRYRFFSW